MDDLSCDELIRRIARTAQMSAAIMRDRQRTGYWRGAERVARQFDRLSEMATEAMIKMPVMEDD